ncbi:acyl CoA binding protein-domain-containing protein [Mycena pura]|uniref:Acyl CoA binding protein-domain-containing protein n=1 Tax=Mycena pura TaxID=153505 RepID=A0AAD6YPN3_9AGAR|nr:acyl CoA binding protein-domain-containing protein [Mycena pura]
MSLFDDAAAYLSNASSLNDVSSVVKLELYGLFKYVTVSPLPTTPRPSIFDFTGRAKWDAWNTAGNTYAVKVDAEKKYLDVARSLGWKEGIAVPEPAPGTSQSQDIWDSDSDEENKASKSSGAAQGFGNSVSSMARPEDEKDNSLHGLVISNDLQGLLALLEQDPNVDLDARDDFGYTALHLAADRGHKSIVEFLSKKGVDRSVKVSWQRPILRCSRL